MNQQQVHPIRRKKLSALRGLLLPKEPRSYENDRLSLFLLSTLPSHDRPKVRTYGFLLPLGFFMPFYGRKQKNWNFRNFLVCYLGVGLLF